MKPIILITLCIAFFNCKALSQQQVEIKKEAQICSDALVRGDYNKFADFMYPKLIEIAGGRSSFIKGIKSSLNRLDEQGAIIKDVTIGEPGEIFTAGTELQCLVPGTLMLKVKNGYVISKNYMLAISMNKGKSWYFLDLDKSDPQQIKQMFPNFNYKLIIPESSKPVFYKDSI